MIEFTSIDKHNLGNIKEHIQLNACDHVIVCQALNPNPTQHSFFFPLTLTHCFIHATSQCFISNFVMCPRWQSSISRISQIWLMMFLYIFCYLLEPLIEIRRFFFKIEFFGILAKCFFFQNNHSICNKTYPKFHKWEDFAQEGRKEGRPTSKTIIPSTFLHNWRGTKSPHSCTKMSKLFWVGFPQASWWWKASSFLVVFFPFWTHNWRKDSTTTTTNGERNHVTKSTTKDNGNIFSSLLPP